MKLAATQRNMLKLSLSAAAGNSGETRQVEKSVQSLAGRAVGGQSMEPHEINDTDLRTVRWTERINSAAHTHTDNNKVGEWLDNVV